VGFAHRPDQILWVEGARAAVKAVNEAGLHAFVATNQSGVARGLYTEADVVALHEWMNGQLALDGAHIDAFVYSPYHPEAPVEAYRRDSDCRKPGPGLIRRLLAAWPVDPERTCLIGDRETDLAAARAAGIRGVLFAGGDLRPTVATVIAALMA
jgi:D-glycero-D-manno-heptose 1,7-bisphosphate phosphatase